MGKRAPLFSSLLQGGYGRNRYSRDGGIPLIAGMAAGPGIRKSPQQIGDSMKSKCITILLGCMIACLLITGLAAAASEGADVSWEEAKDIVLSKVLMGNTEGIWLYAAEGPVAAGSTIETWYGTIALPEKAGWLFFIDDVPMGNWAHRCRYVHVDMAGTVTVLDAYGPPYDLDSWDLIAGSVPETTVPDVQKSSMTPVMEISLSNALPPCTNSDHCYAVLISGGGNRNNNWPRYYTDIQFMYNTLEDVYGYQDDHIYVIMSDGTDPAEDIHTYVGDPDDPDDDLYESSNPDLDGDGDDDVGYAATRANITAVFDELEPILGSGDHLFIFTTDHGGPEDDPQVGTNVVLSLWGQSIRDDQFAAEVEKISSDVPIMITMEQCFSGGFLDDIIPTVPLASGQQRVLATAANATEYSWGDAFSKLWISAVAGHDIDGNPVDADGNDDGVVSMQEAFDYALANDPKDEHPQYGETPAGIGSSLALCSCHAPTLPIANAGPDQYVEQVDLAGTTVTLAGSGSDPCGEEIASYTWTWSGGSATGMSPAVTFPLGETMVTLTVTATDGRTSEPDTVAITIVDTTPPVVTVPADVTVEQASRDGTVVPLTATATDICDADVTITDDAPVIFPLGTTVVTFTATDDSGNSATGTTNVTVVDTTPPEISVTVSPNMLWPPNHKMVNIVASVPVYDICDADPVVVLESITSDEPENDIGIGDGFTTGDIDILADIGSGDFLFKLRAERAGGLDGRVYTITYRATDDSGNSASATAFVIVPLEM